MSDEANEWTYAAYRRDVEEAWEAGRKARELAEWKPYFGVLPKVEAADFIVI